MTVVTVSWNSEQVIGGLISSLAAGLDGLDWRLVVADNASADGTVDLVRRLAPDAVVVQTGRNAGYAAGINAAVAAAGEHDAILICNPDIRLSPGCVRTMLGAMRPGTAAGTGTRTGIVVPRLEDGEGQFIPTLRREPTPLRMLGDALLGSRRAGRFPLLGEAVTDPAAYRTDTVAEWAAGSLMLISRECAQACGPWDESFFLYSEETEYALRARHHGYATRLAPDAVVVHLEGDSSVSPRLWTLLTLNKLRLYRRRHGLAPSVAFWAATLLRELSRAILGNRPSRRAATALVSPARLREVPGP